MPALVQFVGTVAGAQAAVAAATANPANSGEVAMMARMVPVVQAEIAAMGAANSVQVYMSLTHTEKTGSCEFQIDKATPVLGTQVIQLSNQSPAN